MPSISIIGVKDLILSISGKERRSKMVFMLSAFSAAIPASETWEGSAERKRIFERVVEEVGMEVGYPPRERKLWIPSIEMNGGDEREAINIIEMMKDER